MQTNLYDIVHAWSKYASSNKIIFDVYNNTCINMCTKDKVILQLWHILRAFVFNSDGYNPIMLFKSILPFIQFGQISFWLRMVLIKWS